MEGNNNTREARPQRLPPNQVRQLRRLAAKIWMKAVVDSTDYSGFVESAGQLGALAGLNLAWRLAGHACGAVDMSPLKNAWISQTNGTPVHGGNLMTTPVANPRAGDLGQDGIVGMLSEAKSALDKLRLSLPPSARGAADGLFVAAIAKKLEDMRTRFADELYLAWGQKARNEGQYGRRYSH